MTVIRFLKSVFSDQVGSQHDSFGSPETTWIVGHNYNIDKDGHRLFEAYKEADVEKARDFAASIKKYKASVFNAASDDRLKKAKDMADSLRAQKSAPVEPGL